MNVRKINRNIIGTLSALAGYLMFSTFALADNAPYGPHRPVDTAIDSLGMVYIAAGILFVVGLVFVVYAYFFKSKLNEVNDDDKKN